jgi:hypothetical protein
LSGNIKGLKDLDIEIKQIANGFIVKCLTYGGLKQRETFCKTQIEIIELITNTLKLEFGDSS